MTAGRPSPPWDGDVFSGRVLITHKIMAIARTIGGQVGKIVWREVNRGWGQDRGWGARNADLVADRVRSRQFLM